MLEDLRALVECESPTDDLAACKRVVELAAEISKRVTGAKGDVVEEGGRPVFWLGSKSPKVLLLALLDTVWPIGSFTPLWRVEGDLARGPGCFDMKAGFIQALYAMKDLDRNQVALVATTDEETGSATSRALIERLSKSAKAVLVFEAAIDGKVKIGRKGTSMYTITLHGRAAHAGLEPEKGINTTIEMARIVEALVKLENQELGTSVVPTVLKSGTTTNTVPALATLDVDSRSFSMAEMERVKSAIYELKPLHPQARIEVIGGINRPPLEKSSTESLYEKLENVATKLGMGTIGSAVVGGASDGNFAGIHTQVLDGLGAVGSGAHALTENISISDLEPRARLVVELVKEILS
ncbi:MAG: M20 family metallopeptidase [Candidatus Nanopelagicaceae bacterium]|nr:M20 family metallopeptidase [Candidatus Nanopelagicaceae bacterium]